MSILKLMEERYSCRRYADKLVSDEDIAKILEAARVAPTAHNNQPQRIYVLKSEEAKQKLLKDFAYNYKAPCYIVCGYNVDEAWRNDLDENKECGQIDVSIVMSHMMLMAEELELGCCWIGRFKPEEVKKNLDIPENINIVGIFSLGHHREDDKPSKLHFMNKENKDLVTIL